MSRVPRANLETVPTPAEEAALSAFIDASLSDEDPGYPHGAAFVPWQQTPDTCFVVQRYLEEGRAVVLIDADDRRAVIEPPETEPPSA